MDKNNQSQQNQSGMRHDPPQIQRRNTPPEPASTDRPWVCTPFNVEMSATDPQQGPYPFNERHRDAKAIRATIRFVEMLCRIDPRIEDNLVPNWPLDPYVFALMDALRTDFQAAYTSPFGPARPSRIQFSFWTDENSVLQLIRGYTQLPQSISETDLDKKGMFHSPNRTARAEKREQFYRDHAADLGLVDAKTGQIMEPEGTYPWAPSLASQRDTAPDPKPKEPEGETAEMPHQSAIFNHGLGAIGIHSQTHPTEHEPEPTHVKPEMKQNTIHFPPVEMQTRGSGMREFIDDDSNHAEENDDE